MSQLSAFFKKNKAVKGNSFYPATKSLCGEDGEPLMWEIRPIPTKENERIQEACTREVPVTGKAGLFRHKIDTNAYISKLLTAAIVFPDLLNSELQDSYGVKTPEELLKEIVDNPSEYNDLTVFVQNFNGFNVSFQEEIDEAKN